MKKLLLLIFGLFFFNVILAQNFALKITTSKTNKQIIINQNSRIKIKTTDGQKVNGRFSVEDTNTIMIDEVRINLADIHELKRNPLLTSVLAPVFFISVGVITTYYGAIIGLYAEPIALLSVIPAAGMIYIGIKPSSLSKNYKVDKGWKLEIVSLPIKQ